MKAAAVLLVTFFLSCSTAFSQQKYGHIDSHAIQEAMPEYKQLTAAVEQKRTQLENQLKQMYADYQKKATDLQELGPALLQAVRDEQMIELQNLQQSISEFEQTVESQLAEYQMKRLKPLNDKYLKIVNIVAKENGYTYIFDIASGNVVYHPENSGDITDLVKKKMGIQ